MRPGGPEPPLFIVPLFREPVLAEKTKRGASEFV